MPDPTIILALAALALLGVSIWNAWRWPRVANAPASAEPGSVSVLIPARDEEANLPACIESVLAQGDAVREVLIYDDHSSDGTAEVIRNHGRQDARVSLIEPSPLEAGWCGKPFACARLAKAASAPVILFLDADARLKGGALAGIAHEMRSRGVALVAPWPELQKRGPWEKILMPMLNVVVFTTYPAPLGLSRQDPSLGLAHGACLAFSREAYRATGGHGAVRNEIFEDTQLARHLRARGFATACLDGHGVVSVRMYDSFGGIWRGFQKNFYPAFRSDWTFWSFMLLHAVVYLSPFFLLATRPTPWAWTATCAILLMRIVLALRFRDPIWPVLLHPLAEMVLLGVGLSSWFRVRVGRGVSWKGRMYVGDDKLGFTAALAAQPAPNASLPEDTLQERQTQ